MALNLATIPESVEPTRPPGGEPHRERSGGPVAFLRRLQEVRLGGPAKVGVDDLVLFNRQLTMLLKTGNGLAPSLDALASQTLNPTFRVILRQLHDQLEGGSSLSEALGHYPAVFDHLFISLVEAGEATGHLRESLDRLADILETRRRLRSRVREAMTYPAVLSCIMVGVVIFMFAYMVPRFSEIFEGLGDELPATTRLLLGSADLLRSRWWILLPIAGMAVVGIRWAWRLEVVRRILDRLKLRAPLVGRLFSEAYLFQLFSSLGLLLGSRVPHLEAIAIARHAVRNVYYEAFFDNLEAHVEAGRGLTPAFQEARFLPEAVKLMVATGESSGALDTVLGSLSERYREDLESDIRRVSTMLEPLMLVVMGVMVGFVALSFILPLFKMSRVVH